jgi:adenylate kinase family enzyme
MKNIYLVRGIPGSGKTTLAKTLEGLHVEADMYFTDKDGVYTFEPTKIKDAHKWCGDLVEEWMREEQDRIVVSNTFTQEWEMENYYKLAEQYGYRVTSIIVENRHGGVNEHGVPDDKLEQMKSRFNIKL